MAGNLVYLFGTTYHRTSMPMKTKHQPTDPPTCAALARTWARTQRRLAKRLNRHIVKPYRIIKITID